MQLFIIPNRDTLKILIASLNKFGAPVDNLTIADFAKPGTLFVFGIAPN